MVDRLLLKSGTERNALFSGTRLYCVGSLLEPERRINNMIFSTTISIANIEITSSKPHYVNLAGSNTVLALVSARFILVDLQYEPEYSLS